MVKTNHSWINCGFDNDGQRVLTLLLILPLRLVTSDIPQLSGMEAQASGTLAVDDNGCVHFKMRGDSVTTPVWPQGYTVKGDSNSFEVLDASKNVVARSGSPLAIGGGGADSFHDTWTERDCAKGTLWMVGEVAVP